MSATSTLDPERPGRSGLPSSPELQRITGGWWIPVLGGVIAIVFGFLVESFNYTTLWAVTIAAGIGFILTGLADLATAVGSKGAPESLAWRSGCSPSAPASSLSSGRRPPSR